MTKKHKNILDNIKLTLLKTLPVGGSATLYGSRARGDAHKGSDWDVLVVVDKDILTMDDYNTITYPLVMLGWDYNEEINPIMYTTRQWDESRHTPFRENVERDGIKLV